MTFLTRFILLTGIPALVACADPGNPPDRDVYARLDSVREHKEAQLIDYMGATRLSAEAIGQDPVMAQLFVEKSRLYQQLEEEKDHSASLTRKLSDVRSAIEDVYIEDYLKFHDILFIDESGDIFFTLRKKPDYHKNIFNSELSETMLSRFLRESPKGGFVDFENYQIAGEPSAFFVIPQNLESSARGWYVLQFAINKINEMFSPEDDLGRTGEVFLVNKERAMLTDSRFFAQSTVLKKHLSRQNINAKFAEGEGHKTVTDYRGFEAITSFKVITIMGSEWLLIAKIDKDEIVTERFQSQSNHYLLQIEEFLLSYHPPPLQRPFQINRDIEVDMDEFRRVENLNQSIYTHGVRSCTAVVVSYPGKFSYLAHLSANDKIYGGDKTDLLEIIKKRIDDFELPRSEKIHLQITIISPKPQYKENIISNLASWGILLSQIKLIFNASARYANISHDVESAETYIQWRISNSERIQNDLASSYPSLSAVLEEVVDISWGDRVTQAKRF